ncbi:hypothetical protein [Bifidobacterium boum]|uniref:UDP-galactopyranose mutase n=1 Tax=Bifidobacterium boum TaxID=78343 RepID=A0A086ZLR5_9BIFI|nr:hypothetical protein [Bifidobacterium boum]KFI47465.1 UDP-galactopyranose mutase [Bifidobacterium boum]
MNNLVVYILDIGAYSGGGEALYQLGCDLRGLGVDARVVAWGKHDVLPQKFKRYIARGLPLVKPEEAKQCAEGIIIVPENATHLLFEFVHLQPIIWWLSYNNYDGIMAWNSVESITRAMQTTYDANIRRLGHWCINTLRHCRPNFPIAHCMNLVGSYYAEQMVQRHFNVVTQKLVHPIGNDFLTAGRYDDFSHRKNIVLYNPSKPSRLMRSLLKRNAFTYTPINGLNFNQMIELYRTAKLYVDFGNFPGPERMPKEAAYNGCNVLVRSIHAAATDDVMIPMQYKLSRNVSVLQVERKIREMLDNYEEQLCDFNAFRQMIADMEIDYREQVKQIFIH